MSEHPSLSATALRFRRPSPAFRLSPTPWAVSVMLTGTALAMGLQPGPARAEVLYSLTTKCSLKGAAPAPCTVEAVNEDRATLYRHTIGGITHTLRISDQPARFSLWDATAKGWQPLRNAAVRFSTNTLCLNDQALCVVNPNYLNSLLQERPDFRGRDLVRAHFASNGRVDVLCYDTGCDLVARRKPAEAN